MERNKQDLVMKPQIQFMPGLEETTVPGRIRLTKSENGETGTATFLFLEPTIFSFFFHFPFLDFPQIVTMDLLWEKKKITE